MSVVCIDREIELEWKIEQKREEMRNLATELGFLHPDVILCSEHLDELLIQYYSASRIGR